MAGKVNKSNLSELPAMKRKVSLLLKKRERDGSGINQLKSIHLTNKARLIQTSCRRYCIRNSTNWAVRTFQA